MSIPPPLVERVQEKQIIAKTNSGGVPHLGNHPHTFLTACSRLQRPLTSQDVFGQVSQASW